MASSGMRNSGGYYCEQQKRYNRILTNNTDTKVSKQKDNCLPDLGIINGVMASGYNNNALSNNAADIESELFGIGSTNLVQRKSRVNPDINSREYCKWFERNNVFLPAPLVIEKNQRAKGPFSNQ